jgi:hypothetical protein
MSRFRLSWLRCVGGCGPRWSRIGRRAWFGSFADERTDLSTNYDDLLADGFGR